jgi:hypothetical protein
MDRRIYEEFGNVIRKLLGEKQKGADVEDLPQLLQVYLEYVKVFL